MRKGAIDHMVTLSQKPKGLFAKAAAAAREAGIIVPSILYKALEAAGLKITFHTGPGEEAKEGKAQHGAWVQIRDKDRTLVARAYSHDQPDALLQAVYAEMKTEAASAKPQPAA